MLRYSFLDKKFKSSPEDLSFLYLNLLLLSLAPWLIFQSIILSILTLTCLMPCLFWIYCYRYYDHQARWVPMKFKKYLKIAYQESCFMLVSIFIILSLDILKNYLVVNLLFINSVSYILSICVLLLFCRLVYFISYENNYFAKFLIYFFCLNVLALGIAVWCNVALNSFTFVLLIITCNSLFLIQDSYNLPSDIGAIVFGLFIGFFLGFLLFFYLKVDFIICFTGLGSALGFFVFSVLNLINYLKNSSIESGYVNIECNNINYLDVFFKISTSVVFSYLLGVFFVYKNLYISSILTAFTQPVSLFVVIIGALFFTAYHLIKYKEKSDIGKILCHFLPYNFIKLTFSSKDKILAQDSEQNQEKEQEGEKEAKANEKQNIGVQPQAFSPFLPQKELSKGEKTYDTAHQQQNKSAVIIAPVQKLSQVQAKKTALGWIEFCSKFVRKYIEKTDLTEPWARSEVDIYNKYEDDTKWLTVETIGGKKYFVFLQKRYSKKDGWFLWRDLKDQVSYFNSYLLMKSVFQQLIRLVALSIIHNDIKPDNLFFNIITNKAKLIDFGMSVHMNKLSDYIDNLRDLLRSKSNLKDDAIKLMTPMEIANYYENMPKLLDYIDPLKKDLLPSMGSYKCNKSDLIDHMKAITLIAQIQNYANLQENMNHDFQVVAKINYKILRLHAKQIFQDKLSKITPVALNKPKIYFSWAMLSFSILLSSLGCEHIFVLLALFVSSGCSASELSNFIINSQQYFVSPEEFKVEQMPYCYFDEESSGDQSPQLTL